LTDPASWKTAEKAEAWVTTNSSQQRTPSLFVFTQFVPFSAFSALSALKNTV